MSQVPPSTQSTSVESRQKTTSSVRSGEQQLAGNTSESRTRLNISHKGASKKEGTWKYQASAALFRMKDQNQNSKVVFKNTLRFTADVSHSQVLRNGHFNRRDLEMHVDKCSTERRCDRTTTLKSRTGISGVSTTSHVHDDSRRGDEEQLWKLMDEELNLLFRQYCEDWREWDWTPAPPASDHSQEANDEMHHSGDSSHKTLQYARETTGTNLYSEVTGIKALLTAQYTVINSSQSVANCGGEDSYTVNAS